MVLAWVSLGVFAGPAGASDAIEGEPVVKYQSRPWPEALAEYVQTLDKLDPPKDELRKTFFLFYWAAFNNDANSGVSLVAERYYDLVKGRMSTRRELEEAAKRLDEHAQAFGQTNPHDAYSPPEKLAVLRDDLKFLEIDYVRLDSAADASKVGLPADFKVEPNDYCLVITIYPGDDGTLLVLRVIDGRWMIVAGGPRKSPTRRQHGAPFSP